MVKGNHYKIALYVRVSTEEQAESPEGSIRNQEERLRRAVKDKIEDGDVAEIVGVFVDPGLSGKNTNRPQLQRMLDAIRRNEINLVMVTELSRLSRNTKDFSEMWEFFHQHKCEFHSLRERFDTTSAAGEMMLHVMMTMAQFERKQTAERISASFRIRAERGLYNGGSVPLGYRVPGDRSGKLEVIEEEAEVVRQAFKAFLEQGTLALTARWLNANGFQLTRKNQGGGRARVGHFMHDTLHKILRNKAYVGIRVFQTKEGPKETKAVWPAIVDEITFQRVGEILTKNYKRKKPPKPNRYPYTLTGLITCGVCGDRLCGKSAHGKRGKFPYYEHSWSTKRQSELAKKLYSCQPHRIPGGIAETTVWREVEKLFREEAFAKTLLDEAENIHAKHDHGIEIERLKNKIYSVNGQVEALAERLAHLPKDISAEPIYRQMKKLEGSKAEPSVKLQSFKDKNLHQEMPVQLATYQYFLNAVKDWKLGGAPTPEQKQKIIAKIIQKIEIFPSEIKISFVVGRSKIERELALARSLSSIPAKSVTLPLEKYLKDKCSNSLTYGGGGGNRTHVRKRSTVRRLHA